MPFHLTRDGVIAEIPADSLERANAIASRDEWERIAGVWPLKRLVAIWNALPGVTPVEKFTSRQIALERIWRAIAFPEKAQAKAQGIREQTNEPNLQLQPQLIGNALFSPGWILSR